MSTIKVTSNGKGMGQEKNPYSDSSEAVSFANQSFHKWESEHPLLPLISQNGDVVMEPGEYGCVRVWQWCDRHGTWETETSEDEFHTHEASIKENFLTREAYQIAPAAKIKKL